MFEPKISEDDRGIFEIVIGEILAIGGGISIETGNTLGAIVGLAGSGVITADGICRFTKGVSAYRLARNAISKAYNKASESVNGVYLSI